MGRSDHPYADYAAIHSVDSNERGERAAKLRRLNRVCCRQPATHSSCDNDRKTPPAQLRNSIRFNINPVDDYSTHLHECCVTSPSMMATIHQCHRNRTSRYHPFTSNFTFFPPSSTRLTFLSHIATLSIVRCLSDKVHNRCLVHICHRD